MNAKSKGRLFLEENWLTLLVVLLLAGAYVFLRTPGDGFISAEALEARLQAGAPTVIEFYSNSCSICLISKPQVDRLERDLAGQATLLRLNINDTVARSYAARWGVPGVPTFFVLDGRGEVVYARAGAPDVETLKAQVIALRAP